MYMYVCVRDRENASVIWFTFEMTAMARTE